MGAVGIQPRGESTSSRGINYVKVLKAAKILSRHCQPGDIVIVEKSDRSIMPATDGLTDEVQIGPTETLLTQLLRLKVVQPHELRAGDRPFSVRPIKPGENKGKESPVETATLPAPKAAERAVNKPQRGAV